jgi:5-methyltetrahydrofolate--homocysteine methyltransferase
MTPFISSLRSGNVLLMDGAMGTELQRLTQAPSLAGFEAWNLTRPDLIRSVHRAYLDAGAEVLLTNTFPANPAVLDRQNLGERSHEIWEAALRLAREAGPEPHFVLADVGPLETWTRESARSLVSECRAADGILLETWSSLEALKQFAEVLHETTDAAPPLLVSFTFHRENPEHALTTFTGARPEECARTALHSGVVAVGANCGKDIRMQDMVELVGRFRAMCDLPILVRPNAGTPTRMDAGWIYPRSPEAMAAALPALLDAGIAMIGGCCGTTPKHIRAFRKVIGPAACGLASA